MTDYRVLAFRRTMRQREEDRAAAMMVVLEHCHPSQLGELPPSPSALMGKAVMLGIL